MSAILDRAAEAIWLAMDWGNRKRDWRSLSEHEKVIPHIYAEAALVSAWRPIDTASRDGTPVLVNCPPIDGGDQDEMTTAFWRDEGWALVRPGLYPHGATIDPPPTHWMALPERPEER